MVPDNRVAICPGTFDPITHGHLDVISRASAMFDSLIVAVVNHPWRKGQTLFSADRGAMAIVKGLRAISDFEYELEMDQLNRKQAPDVESVYLMASAKYSFLRSSGVKELATFGGDIDELVPPDVVVALKERLGR